MLWALNAKKYYVSLQQIGQILSTKATVPQKQKLKPLFSVM